MGAYFIFRFFSQIKEVYFFGSHCLWFVLGIYNTVTSANKDTFKQLGDIFQCICKNRRSLIHIFAVPECLTLALRQWELSCLSMLFISTKHAWGQEMNVFWVLCDCGDAAWAVQGTEGYYPKHCLFVVESCPMSTHLNTGSGGSGLL